MKWIPINKKTKQEYPAINEEQKKAYLEDPILSQKYILKQVKESPQPKEAKKVTK